MTEEQTGEVDTEWEIGEKETRKALAEGQGVTFPNAKEAIRWLLSERLWKAETRY